MRSLATANSLDAAALDVLEEADAADQMLVDGVVMIHVELHHRDDPAEGADEVAEHAGLVHRRSTISALSDVRISMNSRLASGFSRILRVDQAERARYVAHRVRVEGEIVLLRQAEDAGSN